MRQLVLFFVVTALTSLSHANLKVEGFVQRHLSGQPGQFTSTYVYKGFNAQSAIFNSKVESSDQWKEVSFPFETIDFGYKAFASCAKYKGTYVGIKSPLGKIKTCRFDHHFDDFSLSTWYMDGFWYPIRMTSTSGNQEEWRTEVLEILH